MTIDKSKAQSWSIDIMIGVIVFMGAFFIFFTLLNTNQDTKLKDLKGEASLVEKQVGVEKSPLQLINKDEINISKLNQLKNLTYDELKRQFGIKGDFCIYMEDDKGNVIVINNSYKGVGAPNIFIASTPCSQK